MRAQPQYPRIPPISSLRFVLAAIVLLGHLELPFLRTPQHGLRWAVRALSHCAFNGPAAVIVFFIISGFCIHFPNRNGFAMRSWKAYYSRRYIRILIPMAIAVLLSVPLRLSFSLFSQSILWSLLCEEIYYFLYPALLAAQRRIGWQKLLAGTAVLSLGVIMTNPGAREYPSYGPALNWLVGLPCWLVGCHLAARFDDFPLRTVQVRQIWLWRAGAWLLSVIAAALAFHTSVGLPWSLSLFAIYAVLWMEREIAYYQSRPAPILERAGEASYSVYLIHLQGFRLATVLGAGAFGAAPAWALMVLTAAAYSALFYLLVEQPSHRLARSIGRRGTLGTSVTVLPIGEARFGELLLRRTLLSSKRIAYLARTRN